MSGSCTQFLTGVHQLIVRNKIFKNNIQIKRVGRILIQKMKPGLIAAFIANEVI